MQPQLSQSVTLAVVSGLSEREIGLVVEAINKANRLTFTINREMLPTVRFGTICWSLQREIRVNRVEECREILRKVIQIGLLHAIGRH